MWIWGLTLLGCDRTLPQDQSSGSAREPGAPGVFGAQDVPGTGLGVWLSHGGNQCCSAGSCSLTGNFPVQGKQLPSSLKHQAGVSSGFHGDCHPDGQIVTSVITHWNWWRVGSGLSPQSLCISILIDPDPYTPWSLHTPILAHPHSCTPWSLHTPILAYPDPCTPRSLHTLNLLTLVLAHPDPCTRWPLYTVIMHTLILLTVILAHPYSAHSFPYTPRSSHTPNLAHPDPSTPLFWTPRSSHTLLLSAGRGEIQPPGSGSCAISHKVPQAPRQALLSTGRAVPNRSPGTSLLSQPKWQTAALWALPLTRVLPELHHRALKGQTSMAQSQSLQKKISQTHLKPKFCLLWDETLIRVYKPSW